MAAPGASPTGDPTPAPTRLRVAAAIVVIEAVVEAVVIAQRDELRPGFRVMLILFLSLKWVFAIGVLRLGAGSALGLFLLEGTSALAALGATDATLLSRLALVGAAATAIALLASSLHAFPEPPLP